MCTSVANCVVRCNQQNAHRAIYQKAGEHKPGA
jgi:hypothetical protein